MVIQKVKNGFITGIYSREFVILCLVFVIVGVVNSMYVTSKIKKETSIQYKLLVEEKALSQEEFEKKVFLNPLFLSDLEREIVRTNQIWDIELIFRNMGIALVSIFGLVAVFVINILIRFVKFLPVVFRKSCESICFIRRDFMGMTLFHRYMVAIALLVLLIILIKK